MKRIINSLLVSLMLLNLMGQSEYCNPEALEKAISQLDSGAEFLKDFQVHLEKTKRKEPRINAKYSMILMNGTTYQFSIAESDEFPGKSMFQLYSEDQLIGSTFNEKTGRSYKTFTFKCQKTGKYHMFLLSTDRKECCAVGVLAVLKRND